VPVCDDPPVAASDLAWLGLERVGESSWAFTLTSPLTRPDAKLYGGTGAAVMVALMEAETGRDALWSTVQFVGSAALGERVDCRVEILAAGRRTSQVRMTATVGERIVLAGVGATGSPREGAVEAHMPAMPSVRQPDDCEAWGSHAGVDRPRVGWLELVELRQATEGGSMWARLRSGPQTGAAVAFVADMVPTSVVRAIGMVGGGTSLDNSMRFGRLVDTEWVLLDMDPWLASGGYLHGGARVWSEDGTLIAVASQTAAAMTWHGEDPAAPSPPGGRLGS
jgi:acyl-CoA thioesterase